MRESEIARLPGMMAAAADPDVAARDARALARADSTLLIIGLLSAEWVLRRRWGLR